MLAHSHCRLAPFGVAQFEDDSFLPKMCGVKDEQGALYSFSELFFFFRCGVKDEQEALCMEATLKTRAGATRRTRAETDSWRRIGDGQGHPRRAPRRGGGDRLEGGDNAAGLALLSPPRPAPRVGRPMPPSRLGGPLSLLSSPFGSTHGLPHRVHPDDKG